MQTDQHSQHQQSELLRQALTREIANHLGNGATARLALFAVIRVSERERRAYQAFMETDCADWRIDYTATPRVSATDLHIVDHQPRQQVSAGMRALQAIAQCVMTLSDPNAASEAQVLADKIIRTTAQIWRDHAEYDAAWDDDEDVRLLREIA